MSVIKIIKNIALTSISVSDVGVSIPTVRQYIIPAMDYSLWNESIDVVTEIDAGNLIVNDGTSDLNIAESKNLLKLGEQVAIWNADKIQGITVDNTDIANGKILKYNSTSGNLEYEIDETSASVFGNEYEEITSAGISTTTSTIYQNKIDNTFTGLVDGATYHIQWYTEIMFDKAQRGTGVRIMVDLATVTDPEFHNGQNQNNEWFFFSGYTTKTLSGATSCQVQLQYNSPDLETSSIRRSRVSIWRVL
jgi:hypothetical protein